MIHDTRLKKIEESVSSLSREELAKFRVWFAEYDADEWDAQIEADTKAGKLDELSEQALADHRAGRTEASVNHFASPGFWEACHALPDRVRRLGDRNYALLKRDPTHPSLQFKPVARYWAVRVGLH